MSSASLPSLSKDAQARRQHAMIDIALKSRARSDAAAPAGCGTKTAIAYDLDHCPHSSRHIQWNSQNE